MRLFVLRSQLLVRYHLARYRFEHAPDVFSKDLLAG
jgi:hypothetical protein